MNTLRLIGLFGIVLLLSIGFAFALSPFLPFPSFRIFDRFFLILGLMATYLFRVRLQKKSLATLGLKRKGHSVSLVFSGIAFALLSLMVLTFVASFCQATAFHYHPPKLKKLFYYTTSAILIGFFEEFFFRGLFLQTLMEDFSTWFSVGVSSLVYSLIHFLKPFLLNKPEDLTLFYTESAGLFLFGTLMSYAFLRTRSLYLSMGLHAGFVFFLKMDGIFVNRLIVDPKWLFGEERLIGGIATWSLFLVAFPWVWRLSRSYFPMQNFEKIRSSRSSVKTSPTISPSD